MHPKNLNNRSNNKETLVRMLSGISQSQKQLGIRLVTVKQFLNSTYLSPSLVSVISRKNQCPLFFLQKLYLREGVGTGSKYVALVKEDALFFPLCLKPLFFTSLQAFLQTIFIWFFLFFKLIPLFKHIDYKCDFLLPFKNFMYNICILSYILEKYTYFFTNH